MIEQRRKSSSKDLSRLDAYIASEDDLLARTASLAAEREASRASARASRDAERQALEQRAAHLAEYPEHARLEEIDRVFVTSPRTEYPGVAGEFMKLKRYGHGFGGEIEMAGCLCRKDIGHYVSNSGKTRRPVIHISWTTPDGTRHGDTEPMALNRRSDPKRNWGLGRE